METENEESSNPKELFLLEKAKNDGKREMNTQKSIQPLNLIRLKAQLREEGDEVETFEISELL
jgi:hypothetical protein